MGVLAGFLLFILFLVVLLFVLQGSKKHVLYSTNDVEMALTYIFIALHEAKAHKDLDFPPGQHEAKMSFIKIYNAMVSAQKKLEGSKM